MPQIVGNLAWEVGTETGPVTFADGKSVNFTAFATNIYQKHRWTLADGFSPGWKPNGNFVISEPIMDAQSVPATTVMLEPCSSDKRR